MNLFIYVYVCLSVSVYLVSLKIAKSSKSNEEILVQCFPENSV